MGSDITSKVFAHYQAQMNGRKVEYLQFEEYAAD